ncbi:hypothetical protein [Gordonia effusa]|uniref:hypothetical protein n=1 Tax=Gordonia effusa TaxID=263908 RepID=UPI00110F8F3B|nr:hypothetical protein [Gordonia effusa]
MTLIAGLSVACTLLFAVVDCAFPGRTSWSDLTARAALLVVDRAAELDRTSTCQNAPPLVRQQVAEVHDALTQLLDEWGRYALNIEAWYITKPLLRDTTGTVATTVAYERAMDALAGVAESLHEHSTQADIDHATSLADNAWTAWHAANDYALDVGLSDRSPTERAALQRLAKLVERLTHSAAGDPELVAVKRDIQGCLDKITTVSAGWSDIVDLPAIDHRVFRQLPSPS